jgi:2-keto-4-pentenoate hydratase
MSQTPSEQLLDQVADQLWQAVLTNSTMPHIHEFIAPDDVASAYAIQRRIVAKKIAAGRTRVGRKVGLTNPKVQAAVGVDEPDYGTIFDDMVFESGVVLDPSKYIHPKIESEVCIALGRELTSWDFEFIEQSIEWIAPAFELVDGHMPDYRGTIVDTIADNAYCAGIIIGEKQEYGAVDLAGVELSLKRDGVEITSGIGSNVMGHSVNAVAWLARMALENDVPLQAGEILLPGSIGMIMDFDFGPQYTAEISGLGTVEARFEVPA